MIELQDKFRGGLLGLAIGDALGGRFESQSPEHIRNRFPTVESLIDYVDDELWYTDDTQMAIGVAEALLADGEIVEQTLCHAFVDNYVPTRGYGRGARVVIEAMEEGKDYQAVAANYFPGGSYGNGAAMRVAPVGLLFAGNDKQIVEQARLSALPTHIHRLAIEGAQLLAIAIGYSRIHERFVHREFYDNLLANCHTPEFKERIQLAAETLSFELLPRLGNGIEAIESVATAIACFTLSPDSYEQTIANAILLGGDTDTIAAMAGAISGAHIGVNAIQSQLVEHLEETPKGKSYIIELADRLCEQHTSR
jgi:poly(ADP-ribose) glycohydrolase ARH3